MYTHSRPAWTDCMFQYHIVPAASRCVSYSYYLNPCVVYKTVAETLAKWCNRFYKETRPVLSNAATRNVLYLMPRYIHLIYILTWGCLNHIVIFFTWLLWQWIDTPLFLSFLLFYIMSRQHKKCVCSLIMKVFHNKHNRKKYPHSGHKIKQCSTSMDNSTPILYISSGYICALIFLI